MPTNIEALHAIASQVGDSSAATLPERDNFYEAAFIRHWPFSLSTKLAAFYKEGLPGLDDETLGSSSVRTPVNIGTEKITGMELAMTYNDPSTPFSGYANVAVIHAYGRGPVSGGFLPPDSSSDVFDNDHDQRLSAVLGVNYQTSDYFLNANAVYGSGLTNGRSSDSVNSFGTGLFEFNQWAHTTPSWILAFGAGYTIHLDGGHSFEPSLYVTNLLDHGHLIKGAFFSGAAFEEHRKIIFKLSYHL